MQLGNIQVQGLNSFDLSQRADQIRRWLNSLVIVFSWDNEWMNEWTNEWITCINLKKLTVCAYLYLLWFPITQFLMLPIRLIYSIFLQSHRIIPSQIVTGTISVWRNKSQVFFPVIPWSSWHLTCETYLWLNLDCGWSLLCIFNEVRIIVKFYDMERGGNWFHGQFEKWWEFDLHWWCW